VVCPARASETAVMSNGPPRLRAHRSRTGLLFIARPRQAEALEMNKTTNLENKNAETVPLTVPFHPLPAQYKIEGSFFRRANIAPLKLGGGAR
jgi:hypothetical protein